MPLALLVYKTDCRFINELAQLATGPGCNPDYSLSLSELSVSVVRAVIYIVHRIVLYWLPCGVWVWRSTGDSCDCFCFVGCFVVIAAFSASCENKQRNQKQEARIAVRGVGVGVVALALSAHGG